MHSTSLDCEMFASSNRCSHEEQSIHHPGRLMPIIGRPTREAMFVYTSAMVMGMPVLFSSTCAAPASLQVGH